MTSPCRAAIPAPGTLPVAEIPEPLEIEIWRETLSYFARATGLTLALFDAAGAMRTGPLGANPLTEMLVRAGTWHEPDGLCFAAAREVTRRCVEKAAPAQTVLHGILAIVAVPLREKGQMLGAIAAGWVFTNFPEPISSDRFARTLGLSFPELWQIVRQVAPMTAEKLAHYADLLQMVADLFIKHRADTAEKFALIHDLQTQRAELERAGHARDRLFAVVSHELRTPLTPILGWMPIIREELAAGRIEPLREAFEAVERNARQEAHLIDEMLDLSRILTDRIVFAPEHVAPAVAVAETASLAQSLVRERTLAIRTDLTERLPTVWIDRKRLLQILGNLVSNAVKFTPDGGSITIGARAPASDVEFFVADTGIGVEAGSLELIFDRFQQADEGIARRFGGLGIGLSVVKSLVEMQGGRVRVESPGKNRGATFILTFPAAQNALLRSETSRALPLPLSPASPGPGTSAAAPPPPADMPRWRGAFRVLLVDDNADTLQILRRLLVRAGYEIVIASSARDALAMAKGLKPDALVTDLGMPECDGLELLRQLRAEPGLASLPAIAASGFAGQTEQAAAHVAGFNAYFIKPLDIPLLIDTLDELLRTARPAAPAGAIDASENE